MCDREADAGAQVRASHADHAAGAGEAHDAVDLAIDERCAILALHDGIRFALDAVCVLRCRECGAALDGGPLRGLHALVDGHGGLPTEEDDGCEDDGPEDEADDRDGDHQLHDGEAAKPLPIVLHNSSCPRSHPACGVGKKRHSSFTRGLALISSFMAFVNV